MSPSRLSKLVRFSLGSAVQRKIHFLSRITSPRHISLSGIVHRKDETHNSCRPGEPSPPFRSFVPHEYAINMHAFPPRNIQQDLFDSLVQESFAPHRTTETRNAIVAAVFTLEFVVVRELVVCVYISNIFQSAAF